MIFHFIKFLTRYKTTVRDITIRRALLAEYLSILEVIPDQIVEITQDDTSEQVKQDTIDESI